MSLFTRDYNYELPASLIADRPAPCREDARMMVLHRANSRIEHRRFSEFPNFLSDGDLVVLNDTKVVPARVFSDTGKIEMLFLEQAGVNLWKCMVRPGRKMRVGDAVGVGGSVGRVTEILPDGERLVQFSAPVDFEKFGNIPLPPYIRREADHDDVERYQTVFAQSPGAIAAPTAGLHFTPEILEGIPHAFLSLHVGVGTFKPVQAGHLGGHRMHSERFVIGKGAAEKINAAQRIVAVGTTTVRLLEACAREGDVATGARPAIRASEGATDIFIHPPFQFRITGAMLTNFHIPCSTLLMLVSAFAGREFILHAYAEAVREQYRFYSYGDCMLIL